MPRRRLSSPALSLPLALLLAVPSAPAQEPGAGTDQPAPVPRNRIVALGRVEPISEEVRIAAAMTGRLAAVLFDEGDRVTAGQVVATLENADHLARLQAAEANVAIAEAALERLLNGALPDERAEAAAEVREAEALLTRAEQELSRQQGLAQKRLGSGQDIDNASNDVAVARARLKRARARLAVVDRPARADERARAEAEVALARARLAEARAMVEKSYIRSPLDGTVLRRLRRAGEQVTEMGDTPILAIGDLSRLRVRAEVDEADIAGLAIGQPAYVQADAFGARRFPGRVVRVGRLMGRKTVLSDSPTERRDTRVLEVLIDLDAGVDLPAGLRVDTFIEPAPNAAGPAGS